MPMRFYPLLFMLGLSSPWSVWADPPTKNEKAKWVELSPQGNETELDAQKKYKWSWQTNKEGARVLRFLSLLEAPANWTAGQELKSTDEDAVVLHKGNLYQFSFGSMNNSLQSADGTRHFEVHLIPPVPEVIDESCKAEGIELRRVDKAAPFFIGIACVVRQNKLEFNLTLPNEVRISDLTLFESKGKGESWHVFELPNDQGTNPELGKFQFVYNGQNYNYTIRSTRKTTADTSTITAATKTGLANLGYANLSLQKAGTGSGGAILGGFNWFSKPVASIFGLGGNFYIANPLSQNSAFSYLEASPYFYARFINTPTVNWDLQLFFSFLSLSQSSTGVGLQANQPAIGTTFRFVTGRWSGNIQWMSESLIYSQYVKSQNLLKLDLMKTNTKLSWGGGIFYDSIGAKSTTDLNYQYTILGLSAAVLF